MIEIKTDAVDVMAKVAGVGTRVFEKAYAHAANSTILQCRTFILKAFVQQGMKRKYGAAALQNVKATPNNLNARLIDGGRKIPLAAFSPRKFRVKTARGRRTGYSVQVGPTREVVPGAFLLSLKSGKAGLFQRVGSARLPIRQLFASKVMDVYKKTPGLQQDTEAYGDAVFKKNFIRDFEFYKAKEKR